MMNPLDALSLAGTIIQFVDFSSKVLDGTIELYRSGAETLAVHQQLGFVADDLAKISKRLSDSYWGLSGVGVISTTSDDAFMFICRDASELSAELKNKINNLKVTAIGRRRKWETVMQALKIVERFDSDAYCCRSSLKSMSSTQEVGFDRLESSTKTIINALLTHQDEVSKGIQDQTIAITQLLGRMEILAEKHTFPPSIVHHADKLEFDPKQSLLMVREQTSQEQLLCKTLWQEKAIRLQVAQTLLQSLKFPALKEREESIADVYLGTFEWLFEDTHGSAPWSSFVHWLQHESGIYWVNGKAASGKSTLMRFICGNSNTRKLLEKWSAPLPLVIASFYFWNSGTIEQRSQNGLLRALLAEILENLPDLLPVCFPKRWANIYNELVTPFTEAYHPSRSKDIEPWNLNELEVAMRTLMSQDMQNFKICLFVDGLDEYDGRPSAIAEYFCMLSQVPWLKICLSSRPLLPLDDVFGSGPSLRLQDLTRTDIYHYVKSSLQNDINYQRLYMRQPVQASTIIRKIVSRADGVFLWVKLVLQEIIRGLTNRDTFQDLEERIQVVPQGLEELFSSMLDSIDSFYSKKAATIFLIVRAANMKSDFEPYTPLVCSYVKELEISEARRNILNQLSGLSLFMATVLHYAREADIARSNAYIEPLDRFATLTHAPRFKSSIWRPWEFSSFLHIAVNWDLCAYVKMKLDQITTKEKVSIIQRVLPYALAATDEYYMPGMEQMENADYLRDRVPQVLAW
ncbi:hypothetical protein H4I96_08218 [Botrytis cinerea]